MEYRKQMMDLIIKIDKMKSTTEIKENLAHIVMQMDNAHHENSVLLGVGDREIDVQYQMGDENTVGCMPCICQSKCGDVTVDIDVTVEQPDDPVKKCPLDCRK